MGEVLWPYVQKRDWRVHCYDITGAMRVCVVDSDHGAVRIGLNGGEWEQFFELRVEQVDQFWAALKALLSAMESGGSDQEVRWQGQCYNKWGEPRCCLIEVREHDAVRITCECEYSLELRGDQIGQFQAALEAAMEVCHADVAIHGEHWADDEANKAEETASPHGVEEAIFVEEINKMVAAEAPQMLALVAEIGDRVDAMITVWCVKFPDHTEVISAGPNSVRGSFSSVECAHKLLSAGLEAQLRLISVAEAQRQVKAA